MNAKQLRDQAAHDAATPKPTWLATHAPHGAPSTVPTGVNGYRQVRALIVCPCGQTYAELGR